MNKAIKAALLSALVFPGSGQFYLKRYGRGMLMLMLTLVGLAIVIVRATLVTLDSVKAMPGGGMAMDAGAIAHLAETSSATMFTDNTVILVLLLACWIFSVADAYRIGKESLAPPELHNPPT